MNGLKHIPTHVSKASLAHKYGKPPPNICISTAGSKSE